MDKDILNEIWESNNFLLPYLKQFRNNFEGIPHITELGKTTSKYLDYLESLNCNIEESELYDGIIVINTHNYEKTLEELFTNINKILKDEGLIFFVIRDKTNLIERIEYHLLTKYHLIQEYIGDDNWKFLLYQKSSIK